VNGYNLPMQINDNGGAVYLFDRTGQIVDAVEFGAQVPGQSIGKISGAWSLLANPTPGGANASAAVLGSADLVRFNEWMASPISGDDWFELYNPEANPVHIGGFFVTDDPSVSGRTNTQIAQLTFIAPRGFILLQADGEIDKGPDHVGFSISVLGETLRLYNNITQVDEIPLLVQTPGVSEGRYPDGSANIVQFPGFATPAAPNAAPSEDSDGDGMPDSWEEAHGLNPESAADALLDGDGDGMNNLAEFHAGTDPKDATSLLALQIETNGGGLRVLSFRASGNKTYTILASDSIETPVWERVGNVLAGDERQVDLVDDDTGLQTRFYRIVSPMQL
jgi:hypothetical protein